MYKILITICASFLMTFIVGAQNANRTGIFVEGGVGAVMGDLPVTSWDERDNIEEKGEYIGGDFFTIDVIRKSKPTFGFNVALGYRKPIARSFAIEGKVKFQDATYRFGKTANIAVVPGIKYYSPSFAGNMSIYVHAGVGIGLFVSEPSMNLPYEAGLGLNITPKLYGGLIWNAQYSFADKMIYGKHYGLMGILVGFRF